MPGLCLPLALIVPVIGAGSLTQKLFENNHASYVECQNTSKVAAVSEEECAIRCAQEECSYFQMDATANKSEACILCGVCIHSSDVLPSSTFMLVHTSQLFTGR